jgi:hypothetical protein
MTAKFGSLSVLALGAAIGAGAAFLPVLTTNSEALLRSSFSSALGIQASTPQRLAKSVPLAGSEDFWLSAVRSEGGLPVTKTVAIGDTITITLAGTERKLEVASVSEVTPNITEIDTTTGSSRFVLVTAKDQFNAGARAIRFVMEIEAAPAGLVTQQAERAL